MSPTDPPPRRREGSRLNMIGLVCAGVALAMVGAAYAAVPLYRAFCEATGFAQQDLAPVRVVFRDLSDAAIEQYLRIEEPYDCAGSAKSEGLGIALLESIDSDDPTALVGLPLIRTCRLLRAAGVALL